MIEYNEYNALCKELIELKSNLNVLQIFDNRKFSLLTYAADRNFEECFKALHEHALIYNLSDNEEIR